MAELFPKNFIWGIGVSSHQHEGNNIHSDWWHWEQTHSKITKSGPAVDHWNLLEEDLKRVKSLNLNSYRFNFEWARLYPKEGELDENVARYYQRKMDLIKSYDLIPFISLQHMTWPQWFSMNGGFLNPESPDLFAQYAHFCGTELAPNCKLWTTSVDWSAHLLLGYCTNILPPGKLNPWKYGTALKNFLKAHSRAYLQLKKTGAVEREVGLVHFVQLFDAGPGVLNQFLARHIDYLFNWVALETFKTGRLKTTLFPFHLIDELIPETLGAIDFVGLNYYSRSIVNLNLLNPNYPDQFQKMIMGDKSVPGRTDMGWEIYPEGMYRVLKKIHQDFHLPVYLTEHGLADASDRLRPNYIESYLHEAQLAMKEGVDLRGCYHWSLTDNFEWLEGFGPRFGVYEIDYKTLERKERTKSAEVIRSLARQK